MTPETTEYTCSHCESQGRHDLRYVACLAQTKYWSGGGGSYFNNDNVTIWRVPLCSTCMPKARLFYLDGQQRSAIRTAGVGILGLVGAVVLFLVGSWTGLGSDMKSDSVVESVIKAPKNFLEGMYMLLMAGCFGAGVVMVPYGAVKALVNSLRRRTMTATDVVPTRWLDKCFVGEAERSLALLEAQQGATTAPTGQYPLPGFKELSELSEEERSKALEYKGSVQWRKRTIVSSVGRSSQKLIDKLPNDLREHVVADS